MESGTEKSSWREAGSGEVHTDWRVGALYRSISISLVRAGARNRARRLLGVSQREHAR